MALNNNSNAKANVMNQTTLGIRFKTDGIGEPTLDNTYGGDVTVTKLANTYTIELDTMRDLDLLLALPYSFSKRKDINCVMTEKLSEKKFEFLFDAPIPNTRFDGIIMYVSDTM